MTPRPFDLAEMRSALTAARQSAWTQAGIRGCPETVARYEGAAAAYADALDMLDHLEEPTLDAQECEQWQPQP